jgi:hypothetical protein
LRTLETHVGVATVSFTVRLPVDVTQICCFFLKCTVGMRQSEVFGPKRTEVK